MRRPLAATPRRVVGGQAERRDEFRNPRTRARVEQRELPVVDGDHAQHPGRGHAALCQRDLHVEEVLRFQLEAAVARLHAQPLDRSRPLWRFHVIEGLQDGNIAFYSKAHHATLDGASIGACCTPACASMNISRVSNTRRWH